MRHSGTPAAGVPVSLSSHEILSLFDLASGEDQETDGEGRFLFESVREGTYQLRAGRRFGPDSGDGGRYGATVLGGVHVVGDRSVTGLELRLRDPASLRGVVRDADGRPVSGATIHVRDENGHMVQPIAFVTSDAAGAFTVSGLAEGRVRVLARTETESSPEVGPVEIRSGDAQGASVELRLEPGCTLEVEVLADGEPARARLVVTDAEGRRVSGLLTLAEVSRYATEGFDSRRHVVGPLAPGTYTLEAEAEDGTRARKEIDVRAGMQARGVKLRLR